MIEQQSTKIRFSRPRAFVARPRGRFVLNPKSPIINHKSPILRPCRGADGFSLVEILIALFIFLFGVLGVLSMFPVAMNSAARTIGRVRSTNIAQSALAQLQVDCRVAYFTGTGNLTAAGTLVSTDNITSDWTGYFVTVTAGPAMGQARLIVSTDTGTETLTVAPEWNWDTFPDGPVSYVVTRMGLPSLPRGTAGVVAAASLDFDGATPGVTWVDDEWNGFYVLVVADPSVSAGSNLGEFRRIADTQSPRRLRLESGFPAAFDGDESFAIIRTAPEGLPRLAVQSYAAGPPTTLNASGATWTDDQWNGFHVRMETGAAEGQSRLIDPTLGVGTGTEPPNQLRLTAAFSSAAVANDVFRIMNYATRIGFVREFTGTDSFRAGFADRGNPADPDVAPLNWTAAWNVAPGVPTGRIDAGACGAGTDATHLEVADATNVLPGHLAVAMGDPASDSAAGQVRLVTGKTGNVLDIFPAWAVTPSGNYEIRRRPGHFLVITGGRAAGRVFPITGYSADAANGAEITCDGVNFREIGVTEAKRGSDYKLRNATGFMIVGGDTFLGTLMRTNGSPTLRSFQDKKDYGYALNTFGSRKTAEPQVGADFYFDGANDRETSDYGSVCIFSEGDALPDAPVRVDVFVFRNFNSAGTLWDNQKPVGHITGYIARP